MKATRSGRPRCTSTRRWTSSDGTRRTWFFQPIPRKGWGSTVQTQPAGTAFLGPGRVAEPFHADPADEGPGSLRPRTETGRVHRQRVGQARPLSCSGAGSAKPASFCLVIRHKGY